MTLALAALLALAAVPGRARADGPGGGGDVTVALSMGPRELTATIRRVTSVPGPLHVDLVSHRGSPAGSIAVSVVPVGASTQDAAPASGVVTARSSIELGAVPGSFGTAVDVDRPGPWELILDDGEIVARVPFIVPAQSTSPLEFSVYAGFIGAGAFLLGAIAVALYGRRSWWTAVPAAAATICLSIAVHAAILSPAVPPPPTPGVDVAATLDNVQAPHRLNALASSDLSRPPAAMLVDSEPREDGRTRLVIAFRDGATGAPADDLVVHDGALVHLLLVSPRGALLHLHPVRTGAGRYQVDAVLSEDGTYATSAEIARQGGGVQNLRLPAGVQARPADTVAIADDDVPSLSPSRPAVTVPADDGPIDIAATGLTAGAATSLEVVTGPRNDLQLWLGMLGHLIIAGPLAGTDPVSAQVARAPMWSHAHSMGGTGAGAVITSSEEPAVAREAPGHGHGDAQLSAPPAHGSDPDAHAGMIMAPTNGDSAPDETVAAYGPTIAYTFVFPEPGVYRVWIQFARDFAVVTVPLALHVSAAGEDIP